VAQEYEDQEKREMRGSWRIGAPEQSVFNLDFRSPPCEFSRTRQDSFFPRPPFCVKLGPEEKQIENEAK
jgi:hypothetical protein